MKKFLPFIFLIFLSSCFDREALTKKLWEASYRDRIRQFFVSPNGANVVFLGEKYDYVLNDRGAVLKSVLFSKYRYLVFLDIETSDFQIKNDPNLIANITIKTNTVKPPFRALQELRALGFSGPPGHLLTKRVSLMGRRYKSVGEAYYARSLDRAYDIEVHGGSELSEAEKMALTPLAVTADAVLYLGEALIKPLSGN